MEEQLRLTRTSTARKKQRTQAKRPEHRMHRRRKIRGPILARSSRPPQRRAMKDVSTLLRTLGFVECRLEGEEQFSELNGQFDGETTDEMDLFLRPNDRDGIAHVKRIASRSELPMDKRRLMSGGRSTPGFHHRTRGLPRVHKERRVGVCISRPNRVEAPQITPMTEEPSYLLQLGV